MKESVREVISGIVFFFGVFCMVSGINMLYQYRFVYDWQYISIWNIGFSAPTFYFFGVTVLYFATFMLFLGVGCVIEPLIWSPEIGSSLLWVGRSAFMMFAVTFLLNGILILFGAFLALTFLAWLGRAFYPTKHPTEKESHIKYHNEVDREKNNREYFREQRRKKFFGMGPTSPSDEIEKMCKKKKKGSH